MQMYVDRGWLNPYLEYHAALKMRLTHTFFMENLQNYLREEYEGPEKDTGCFYLCVCVWPGGGGERAGNKTELYTKHGCLHVYRTFLRDGGLFSIG